METSNRTLLQQNKKLICKYFDRDKIQGGPKQRDEKGKEYPDIESFQNRTTLQEIEIKEEKRKYTVPQGRINYNQGENNKQKGE